MPDFTIETTYHLPVFRHRSYAAETLEAACRAAIEDGNWEISEKDQDSSREIHVTGVWEGTHAAYTGPSIPVPPQFDEAVQRRARHFEILLGLLKIFFDDAHAAVNHRSIGLPVRLGRLPEEKPFSRETRILTSLPTRQNPSMFSPGCRKIGFARLSSPSLRSITVSVGFRLRR